MQRTWVAGVASALLVFGAEPIVKREGPYWVLAESGSLAARQGSGLAVKTRGTVIVQGGAADGRYQVKKKVRARSEQQARQLLKAFATRTGTARDSAYLSMAYSPKSDVMADLRIQVPATLGRLSIDTEAGDVQVYDIAGSVRAESGGGFIQMDRIGRDVVARTAGGELRFGQLLGGARCFSGGGSIHVAQVGAEAWFETAGGEIYVRQASGPVHASTGGGNIRVERAALSVSARTAGGRIDVQQAGGLVFADNTGGSIQIGSARGVQCESAGGGIRLRGASGALRAATDVGSIFAELAAGLAMQDSVLSSSAGDIIVSIPASLALTIRALNESRGGSRIVSEFVEIPVRQFGPDMFGVSAEGILNGGGPVLQVSSRGGTIYLRRVRN